jgi:elongation factor G
MNNYKTENLRNLGLIGHSGSGKTMLTESILYFTEKLIGLEELKMEAQ